MYVKDAHGCINSISFQITQPSTLGVTAAATANPLTCFNDTTTITVTATGGTTPYTYSINGTTYQSSTKFFGRAAGTYNLSAKDAAGVVQSVPLIITQPTQISISEKHGTILTPGGTTSDTLTASGGTGTLNYKLETTVYQASNIFSSVLAGQHTATVRDANLCTNTLTFTITQPTALVVGS